MDTYSTKAKISQDVLPYFNTGLWSIYSNPIIEKRQPSVPSRPCYEMNERTHTSKERPQKIPTRQHTPTIQQHSEKDARGIGNAVGKGGKFNGRHIVSF